ncbi:unnamed protein product [Chrysoparadoxa australica]
MSIDGAPFSADGLMATKTARVETSPRLQALCAAQNDESDIPDSYVINSDKEALCLEYIGNFRKEFEALYPKRQPLYLTAQNEYGVEKFVCTTLRPTQLPYREVYDLASCAEFVAHFLHYEPLEHLTSPPRVLPSPGQIINWTVADSFDMSLVLCSLLLGSGYDAFVVSS